MTSAELSGMECDTGRNPTSNGPVRIVSGHGFTVCTLSGFRPCSSILRRAWIEVKARA